MIATCIAKHGPQHFVDKSSGAYALVWINLKDQTLNFLRNGERTLWFCRENDTAIAGELRTLWWASEASMLMFTLSRYTSYSKDKMKYEALPENEWWSFPLNVTKKVAEPTIQKCKKEYKWTGNGNAWSGMYPYSSWEDGYDDRHDVYETKPLANSTPSKLPVVVPLKQGTFQYTPPGEGERKRFLTVAEVVEKRKSAAARATGRAFDDERTKSTKRSLLDYCIKDDDEVQRRLKAGPCVWCSEVPQQMMPDMAPTIFPVKHTTNRNEYVCSTCINDLDVQSFVGVK
jgi:hypothetical protein